MKTLRSFVSGTWTIGHEPRITLYDPTYEEPIAQTSTGGIDFAAALSYARTRGGAALRELTFAQRGEMLGALAKAIHQVREELIELGIKNGGSTRSDAKFDIDGATGTLAHYAALGATLGNTMVLLDGAREGLARSPRYVGQHAWVSLHGVALHINAFNFPVWGFAEKAAVALLAGMPVVTKPATSTAMVAERALEAALGAKVLPDGALSLVCGGAGDLLDHLRQQDVLALTGSSHTAQLVRSHLQLRAGDVRQNVEADSLNAAVLAPDVADSSDAYGLFLAEVARDVTQKAGQKCTATRRVIVPIRQRERVCQDLAERLGNVRVGDPRQKDVRMGPLATAAQLRDVQARLGRLREVTEVISGGDRGTVVGVDENTGYFLAPTLLLARTPEAAGAVHDEEVFGPVATVMGYDETVAGAAHLVRLGGGGLVCSLYTDDATFVAGMLGAIGAYSGRLHLGSSKIAEHSVGPGTVLPHMIHGGPGRAGGGEELGGLRGLAFYMQRVGVQGYAPLLDKILSIP